MREIRTSGLMSGDGKRGGATAPVLDSTKPTDCQTVGKLFDRPGRALGDPVSRTSAFRGGASYCGQAFPIVTLRSILRRQLGTRGLVKYLSDMAL